MPSAAPRKPAHAKTGFALSKGQTQCGAFVLVLGVMIGISVYFSPSEKDESAPKGAKAGVPAAVALTDETFDSFMALHPEGVLVDFSTKKCGFCEKLSPQFEKAAKELKAEGPALAVVDSETGSAIVQKYGINRYPTVMWIWKGQSVLELQRVSEKSSQKIVEWARWATTPAIQELETYAEFEEALPTLRATLHSKARLFAAWASPDSAGMKDAFEAAAQRHRATTVFLHMKDAAGAPDGPAVRSYGPSEADDDSYTGAASDEDVTAWVKATLEKAKPLEEEKAKSEEAKPAATKAMEQVQKALMNAKAAEAEEEAEAGSEAKEEADAGSEAKE